MLGECKLSINNNISPYVSLRPENVGSYNHLINVIKIYVRLFHSTVVTYLKFYANQRESKWSDNFEKWSSVIPLALIHIRCAVYVGMGSIPNENYTTSLYQNCWHGSRSVSQMSIMVFDVPIFAGNCPSYRHQGIRFTWIAWTNWEKVINFSRVPPARPHTVLRT